jgi:hypothetical protein
MKSFPSLRLILLLSIFCCITTIELNANPFAEKVARHKDRFVRDSLALSDDYTKHLHELEEWLKTQPEPTAAQQPYYELLDKYLSYIKPSTFRRYATTIHDDIISQALSILKASSDPSTNMQEWTGGLLPEYYAAVKTLMPPAISKKALMEMASDRPQELISQFSKLDYSLDQEDLIAAMKNSPHQFSKFMHYNNQVKTVLLSSTDPDIKVLSDIYSKFRYSDKAYYLLPLIISKEISIEQAEQIAGQEHLLLNYLALLKTDSSGLAKNSIEEKWAALSGKYLSRIKQQRFTAVNSWKMDALEQVSDTTRALFLFLEHPALSPQETEALMRWTYLRHFLQPLPSGLLDPLPLRTILQLQARVAEQNLQVSWGQLWGPDSLKTYIQQRKKALSPNQLATLQKELPGSGATLIAVLPKPKEPEFIIKTYYFNLPDEEKALIKWKSDPFKAMDNIKDWINTPYAGSLLQYLAKNYPLEIVKHLDEIKLKPAGIDALKAVARHAPLSAKNFIIQPLHPWNILFRNSTDSVMKTLYSINKDAGSFSRAYLLLDDIYKGNISIEDADSLGRTQDKLLKHLIAIAARPDALGRYSVEQELAAKSLKFVRQFNISENTDQFFASQLSNLSAEALYTFMTYGEDEIIERGFRKMLHQLLSIVPGGNLYPLMEKVGFNQYRKFLRKCAYYEMGDLLYKPMSSGQKEAIAHKLLTDLEHADDEIIIQVADIILSLDHPAMADLLHQNIKKEYERCEKAQIDKGVAVYGVLSALLAPKVEKGWAKYVAEKFILPSLDVMPVYELFNQQMANIQQYYFYDDEDGVQSFNNFIKSYQKSALEWEIKDMGNFVIIQSKAGRKVDIYANKAKNGEKGIDDMLKYMSQNKLEPQVVVHRGLSTHTLKTFSRVPSSAKLILDGSCGGYHVQQIAIDRAPGAQILCNRNVGTMYVNDPIFKQISDDIRVGKDIIWPEFWSKMNSRVGSNPYFKDYIPPHKNAAALLLKALYDVLEIN